MKTTFATCLVCVLCASAQENQALSPELARLKTNYQAAVTKAIVPLNSTYRKELERLRDSFTRDGKLDAALQVRRELDALDGKPEQATLPGSPAKQVEAVKLTLPTLEATTWIARAGSIEKLEFHAQGAMTVLMRDGKKFTGWTYQQVQDGSFSIKATGPRALPGTLRYTTKGLVFEGVFEGYKEDFKIATQPK